MESRKHNCTTNGCEYKWKLRSVIQRRYEENEKWEEKPHITLILPTRTHYLRECVRVVHGLPMLELTNKARTLLLHNDSGKTNVISIWAQSLSLPPHSIWYDFEGAFVSGKSKPSTILLYAHNNTTYIHTYSSSLLIYFSTWKSTTMVNFFNRISSRNALVRARKHETNWNWGPTMAGYTHSFTKLLCWVFFIRSLIPYYGQLNKKRRNNNSSSSTSSEGKGKDSKSDAMHFTSISDRLMNYSACFFF